MKGVRIATIVCVALGILALLVPIIIVKASDVTFTEKQTAIVLSGCALAFIGACGIRFGVTYAREKRVNVFCLCTMIVLLIVGVGVWF